MVAEFRGLVSGFSLGCWVLAWLSSGVSLVNSMGCQVGTDTLN